LPSGVAYGPQGCRLTSDATRDGAGPSRGRSASTADREATYEGWEPPSADATYDPSCEPSPLPDVPQGPPHYTFAPPPAYPPPYYLPPPPYGYPYPYLYPPGPPPSPMLPTVGGVLCIVSGTLNLVFTLFISSALVEVDICAAILLIFSIIAILGGLCALLKRLFVMAIVGAVFAMLSPLTFGAGFIMGLVGLILIAIGKDSFVPMDGVPQFPPSSYPPPPY